MVAATIFFLNQDRQKEAYIPNLAGAQDEKRLTKDEAIALLDKLKFKYEIIEEVVSHPILDPVIACLDAYFKGKSQDLSNLPLAPIGTDFEKRVWAYLQEIPYGQTVTYGQIAKDLQVASAQAIGGAVGRNPWSILVPCHRVLGAGKRLTGYAAGVEKKAWLLEHEGADFKDINNRK